MRVVTAGSWPKQLALAWMRGVAYRRGSGVGDGAPRLSCQKDGGC